MEIEFRTIRICSFYMQQCKDATLTRSWLCMNLVQNIFIIYQSNFSRTVMGISMISTMSSAILSISQRIKCFQIYKLTCKFLVNFTKLLVLCSFKTEHQTVLKDSKFSTTTINFNGMHINTILITENCLVMPNLAYIERL